MTRDDARHDEIDDGPEVGGFPLPGGPAVYVLGAIFLIGLAAFIVF